MRKIGLNIREIEAVFDIGASKSFITSGQLKNIRELKIIPVKEKFGFTNGDDLT